MEIKEFVLNKTPHGKEKKASGKQNKTKDNVSRRVAQAKKSYAKKTHRLDWNKIAENQSLIMFISLLAVILLTVILGMTVFGIPVVTVCIVIIIEAALAACLHDLPIWLHGIVLAAELILGIVVHKIIFMMLAAICYLAAIFLLQLWQKKTA